MYLFILESIGTQELILIGLVALIIFGPRKLPELARMIGKTMADFRKVTNEFKSTWEKEVAEDKKMIESFSRDPEMDSPAIKLIKQPNLLEQPNLLAPQVKELDSSEIEKLFPNKEIPAEIQKIEEPQQENAVSLTKRDWL